MIAVSVALAFIASAAYIVNRQLGIMATDIQGELEAAQARYLARAALNHAIWKANKTGCTVSYPAVSGSLAGQGTYNATSVVSTGSGTPTALRITATGSGPNGASFTLVKSDVRPHSTTPATTTFTPSMDTMISGNDKAQMDKIFGGGNTITFNKNQKILIDFPPAFYTYAKTTKDLILSETLSIYQQNKAPSPLISFDVYPITNSWAESGATWNARDKSVSRLWTTPGGDYSAQLLATAQVLANAGWIALDLTDTAEGWKNNNIPVDYGFALVPPSTNSADIKFNSTENSSNNPYLTVRSLPACP